MKLNQLLKPKVLIIVGSLILCLMAGISNPVAGIVFFALFLIIMGIIQYIMDNRDEYR